jgi:hypothetical protein
MPRGDVSFYGGMPRGGLPFYGVIKLSFVIPDIPTPGGKNKVAIGNPGLGASDIDWLLRSTSGYWGFNFQFSIFKQFFNDSIF